MSQFLFQYHPIPPTTWVYLSSLLMIGLFFKFARLWSVRNLDLLMLILFAPGLLWIHLGQIQRNEWQDAPTISDATGATPPSPASEASDLVAMDERPTSNEGASAVDVSPPEPTAEEAVPEHIARIERLGYFWLLGVSTLWFVRMLLDTRLTRRPLLSPNLSFGGMAFIGVAIYVFLMANVLGDESLGDSRSPDASQKDAGLSRMDKLLKYQQPDKGPGYAALDMLPAAAEKTLAVLSHLTIALGLVAVAYRHFGNLANGIGAATLFLMLPYTSQMTGRVDHFFPAALLVWAVFFYRRPVLAGALLGLACGCIYYPLFLLPLWVAFYWHRGALRFALGVLGALVLLTALLRITHGEQHFVADVQRMFGILIPRREGLEGVWNTAIGGWDPVFRLPVLAAATATSLSLILWPAQKNLGTLISCSAAVMISSQFWHGYGGGLFVAWFLPLLLLAVFRPNLEDRVAQTMLNDSSLWRRRPLGTT